MGIDPGIATVGYGVVNYDRNNFKVIQYGVITTPRGFGSASSWISTISARLSRTFKPDSGGGEEHFSSNHKMLCR